jgi:hypothetical protein
MLNQGGTRQWKPWHIDAQASALPFFLMLRDLMTQA